MSVLRDFWALARPFWGTRHSRLAWLLLASVIGIGVLLVQLNVWFSYWNKDFYDALAVVDTARIYPLLGKYCLLVAAAVVMAVYLDWLRKLLILKWRAFMTEQLMADWLRDNAFYRLGLAGEPDNPDQRIAEDVNLLVTDSLDILRSFISAVTRIVSFAGMLWGLSSDLVLPFVDQSVRIPGYLVWFALGYAIFGSFVAERIGHVLQSLNYEQQRREADLRAELLRRRDHAEQIAFYGGGAHEHRRLMQRFGEIAGNWRALMNRERALGFFSVSYNRINGLVPIFAALPSFMAKSITLGGLMQISTAFTQTASALSWFIQAYDEIAKWKATVARLTQFRLAIENTRVSVRSFDQAERLAALDMNVNLPDGRALLQQVSFCVEPGSWVRLAGRSGLGKSSLLRCLAGLWPYFEGELRLQRGRSLFLPQHPYLATASLADILSYPAVHPLPEAAMQQALVLSGLGALQTRLAEEAEWSRVLSGGEQQRLSIARVLLQRPDCVFMDEATSQLDESAAVALHEMLRRELPGMTLVSVSHQSRLANLFDHAIQLGQGSEPKFVQPHGQESGLSPCYAT
ncbi:ABC transporter ATP-binding protein/permease [Uliginosibacterium sp. 31-12]|uniref:ABC transporter ATP-binding protein/permease n=1 Tax=Uliginosibacterium sp. 31-12 TaxID=3062781 RepID=UPI0026E304CF|nr:ABC transporter ATP-binding protein/permease [Uliginosibacterium sp. 31-12]MDO6385402.1 ABC transporter ATP-binding protein/permease [Uliginosibacterium sp. 31-12]